MRAVVVYESMYGNTHVIAERVGDGLRAQAEVVVVPVAEATPELIRAADLLIVGGPTHVHTMSSERSREAAMAAAAKPNSGLTVDASAGQVGLREWLARLPDGHGRQAAAFDTRMTGPALVTGRASRRIARRLERHGFDVVADPASFLVDHSNHLFGDAMSLAYDWGRLLVTPLQDEASLHLEEYPT